MEVTHRLTVQVLREAKNKWRQFALLNYVVIKDSFYTADEIVERGIKRGRKLMKVSECAGGCSWQVKPPLRAAVMGGGDGRGPRAVCAV